MVMQISVTVKEVRFVIFWFNALLGYKFTLVEIIYQQKSEVRKNFSQTIFRDKNPYVYKKIPVQSE